MSSFPAFSELSSAAESPQCLRGWGFGQHTEVLSALPSSSYSSSPSLWSLPWAAVLPGKICFSGVLHGLLGQSLLHGLLGISAPSWYRRILPFLNYIYIVWLRGWAVGLLLNPLELAMSSMGQPLVSPHRGCLTASTCPPRLNTQVNQVKYTRFIAASSAYIVMLGQNTISFCLSCHKPEVNAMYVMCSGKPGTTCVTPFCEPEPRFRCWVMLSF